MVHIISRDIWKVGSAVQQIKPAILLKAQYTCMQNKSSGLRKWSPTAFLVPATACRADVDCHDITQIGFSD